MAEIKYTKKNTSSISRKPTKKLFSLNSQTAIIPSPTHS